VRRSGDIRWGEYRLGIVIVAGIAIFLWASIRGGSAFFEKRAFLNSNFHNVAGLNEGSPVWYRGLEVGTVKKIAIRADGDTSYVTVRMSVQPEVLKSLNSNSKARISAINFFGEKFMDLTPGTPGAGRITTEDTLRSEEVAEFADLMDQGQGTLKNLDRLSRDLLVITAKIRDGRGSLGLLVGERSLYDDLERLTREMTKLATNINGSQNRAATALTGMAIQIDSLTSRANRGQGTLGLIATDPKLYHSLTGAASGLDSTLGLATKGAGSASRILNDPRAYDELSNTLANLNKLLEDIRKNPQKYFKVSVF
jgi:phospholipid/cholesterol/gamma-HCH transport system substrate-binding protein